ncbi:MAG: glycosyltransferase family 2 protein [Bacillota bacterium]
MDWIIPQTADSFTTGMLVANLIFGGLLCFVYFNQNFHMIFGLFCREKKYKKAGSQHKFGYLICAHNEEVVIGDLIDSIKSQNYPSSKQKIFVVCDNCTDKTFEICKEKGVFVICRNDKSKIGKSYALDFLLKNIISQSENSDIEAFFVFDADNILSQDFTSVMNDMFDSGVKIGTGFRNSKNYDSNWRSAGASQFFLREMGLMHKSRARLGLSCYVSGTGFYVSSDILQKMNGWNYNTMTEDLEFSIDQTIKGEFIGYAIDAVFYDEQPIKGKDSFNQRMRWTKGAYQCGRKYRKQLLTAVAKNRSVGSLELLIHTLPLPVITLLWNFAMLIITGIHSIYANLGLEYFITNGLFVFMGTITILLGISFVHGLATFVNTRNKVHCKKSKALLYCLTFPIYMLEFLYISMVAVTARVTWKKVDHNVKMKDVNLKQKKTIKA